MLRLTSSTPATLVASTMKSLERLGLNRGTSGNVSVRDHRDTSTFFVSPSAIPATEITRRSVRQLALSGNEINANPRWRASSEWPLHAAIYLARPDVGAIVHTHSTYAVALSSLRLDIPPFHYLTALAGGSDIRCASYETFGTQELASSVLSALDGRLACLMANHGLVAVGKTMGDALGLAVEVEELCRQFLIARSVGDPILLTSTQMSEVSVRFGTYRRTSP